MSTTRASQSTAADLDRIRHTARWLLDNIDTLHALSWSNQHQNREQVGAHTHTLSGPDISQRMHPQLRERLNSTARRLRHMANEIGALKVSLEPFLDDQAYDPTLIGTLLEPGELEQARKAKQRRDAMAGDPRWGEWEATADNQPGRSFK